VVVCACLTKYWSVYSLWSLLIKMYDILLFMVLMSETMAVSHVLFSVVYLIGMYDNLSPGEIVLGFIL